MKTLWTTADGTEIPVNKLKDSHILNILKKWPTGKAPWIAGIRNDKGVKEYHLMGHEPIPGYKSVKHEAIRRGLI